LPLVKEGLKYLRIARSLRQGPSRAIGFIPISPKLYLPPYLERVAGALIDLSGEEAIVVEPWSSWPSANSASAVNSASAPPAPFAVDRSGPIPMAKITPTGNPTQIGAARRFSEILPLLASEAPHLLVDLTDLAIELAIQIDFLDGLFLVARSGHCRQRHLVQRAAMLPAARNLGVVLID
jgi:hypothetical protein